MHHRRPGEDTPARWVRPDPPTAGGAHPGGVLPLEKLIETTPSGRQLEHYPAGEHRAICALCRTPRAVAEVAATRGLPLEATRVLLADLLAHGRVVEHPQHTGRPSMSLLQRVLDGLARL